MVPPQTFNRLFTMHGTTMVFLVGIPIVFGFGNYLVPLMIGARDLAFPRLNAFGFWILLFGGLLLHFSFIGGDGLYGAGSAPAVGWFAYAPLTGRAFTPGNATDYWNLAIFITGDRDHRHRGQSRDHHPDHAGSRDDPRPHARLRVDHAHHLGHDPRHPASPLRRPDHAHPRPLSSARTSSTPRRAAPP